jgi:transcriptional regulator with XRE-family HTH domain
MTSAWNFGARLTAARQRRDFSQAKLAEMTGIDQSVLSHYERGTRAPGAENIAKIARALDVTADFLLSLSTETRRLSA